MNTKIFFSCALCNKIGAKLQCERCNEAYCSQNCQAIHWPIHRKLCFPMPNLIPLDNLMISSQQSSIHYQYSATTSLAVRQSSCYKWNSYGWCSNVEETYKGKQNQRPIVKSNSRFLAHFSPGRVSDCFSTEEHPIETKFDSKKWYEEFLFGQVSEVIVQYFTESPTTNCWVIQRNDLERRDAIMKSVNLRSAFDTLDCEDIQLDHVYSVQLEGVCHRGLVLHRLNSSEIWVRLIDNGRSFRARINTIRKLYPLTDVKGLAFEINFDKMLSIQMDEVLRVENISHNSDGAIDVRIVEEEKLFFYQDIDAIPLPVNVPLELFCLDHSNIHMGYLSVCQYDRKKIESISEISNEIAKRTEDNCNNSYCPKSNELCLAYIEDDGQWYRSKCVEIVMPYVFRLEMIDYGTVEQVTSKNIRRMVQDFIQPPIIKHHCTIFGVEHQSAATKKITEYFNHNSIFYVTRAILCGGQYIIYVPDLLKFINE